MSPAKKRKQTIAAIMLLSWALITGSSCSSSVIAEKKRLSFKEIDEVSFENHYESKVSEFLVKAASINLEGILLGHLALEKGTSASVKGLGKMLIGANEKGLKEATALAGRKFIKLPSTITNRGQYAYKKLDAVPGKAFDVRYSAMVVALHREAIQRFDSVYNSCTDPEISQWALAALPLLRNQLDEAINCQMKCEKVNE